MEQQERPSTSTINVRVVSPYLNLAAGRVLRVPPSWTVRQFKAELATQLASCPAPSGQRLVFAGRIMKDVDSLETALNVRGHSSSLYTLHLAVDWSVDTAIVGAAAKSQSPAKAADEDRSLNQISTPRLNAAANPCLGSTTMLPTAETETAGQTIGLEAQAPIEAGTGSASPPEIETGTGLEPQPASGHQPRQNDGNENQQEDRPGPALNISSLPQIELTENQKRMLMQFQHEMNAVSSGGATGPGAPPASSRPRQLATDEARQAGPANVQPSFNNRVWLLTTPSGLAQALLVGPESGSAEEAARTYVPNVRSIRDRLSNQREEYINQTVGRRDQRPATTRPVAMWEIVGDNPGQIDPFDPTGGDPASNETGGRRDQPAGHQPAGGLTEAQRQAQARAQDQLYAHMHAELLRRRNFNAQQHQHRLHQRQQQQQQHHHQRHPDEQVIAGWRQMPPANDFGNRHAIRGGLPAQPVQWQRIYRFNIQLRHVWTAVRIAALWYFFSGPIVMLLKSWNRLMVPGLVIGLVYLLYWCGVFGDTPAEVYSYGRALIYGPGRDRPYTAILSGGPVDEQATIVDRAVMVARSGLLVIAAFVSCMVPSVGMQMVERQLRHRLRGRDLLGEQRRNEGGMPDPVPGP